MAEPATLQKTNGKYLWFSLLALGFQPESAPASAYKTNLKHINLGMNMFDKPNKDGFYIVSHFLLEKLNPARFREAYRHCWPVLNNKADAEFRRNTCAWIKEIMDEENSSGPKVVASVFLSPGGPKFTALMHHLARHVMLQEMKTFNADDGWVPVAAAEPAPSLHVAVQRLKQTKKRFLKAAVHQGQVIQEYQKRAQSLSRAINELGAESAKYDELLKRHEGDMPTEESFNAREIEAVRSLWSSVDKMLSKVKDDRRVMECVMKGAAEQHVLDGTDVALRVPRVLLETIERVPQHLSSGNVYKAGQLNLLCLLELMNHALQLLRDKRSQVGAAAAASQLHPQRLREKSLQLSHVLEDLHALSQKISKEEIPEVRHAIGRLEAEWDRKWKKSLADSPRSPFLTVDPALNFLSPMAPLSFEPANEGARADGVFSLYPARLLEAKRSEATTQEEVPYPDVHRDSFFLAPIESADTLVSTADANTQLRDVFDTPSPPLLATPSPKPAHRVGEKKLGIAGPAWATIENKSKIFDWECDNLADQFADAVVTTSPLDRKMEGLDLGDLLSTLGGDPFCTRKQLPRTPESLIMDVTREAQRSHQSSTFAVDASYHTQEVQTSPRTPSDTTSCDLGSVSASHGSPLPDLQWLSALSDTVVTPLQSDSDASSFNLVNETLPNCLSFPSTEEEEEEEEEQDLLLFPEDAQASGDASFLNFCRRQEGLLSHHPVAGPAKTFSLDLDLLESPSPSARDYSLPLLIAVSPMEDLLL